MRLKKGETFWGWMLTNGVCFREEPTLWGVHVSHPHPWKPIHTRRRGAGEMNPPSLPTTPVGDYMWKAASQLTRTQKPSWLLHPRGLGSQSFSPLTLLSQIQMACTQFLLAVSIPNENSAPSVTSATIISNPPCPLVSRLIANHNPQR